MSIETERLEVRVDAATKARIEDAAARLDQSTSMFVMHAVTAPRHQDQHSPQGTRPLTFRGEQLG